MKLSEELVWRKKELSRMKDHVISQRNSVKDSNLACRCGVAMLYAHWEGFIKVASCYYLEYVAMQRHSVEELSENMLAVILREKLTKISPSEKLDQVKEVMDILLNKPTSKPLIPFKTVINTGSNLSSNRLREITSILGVDFSPYETKQKLIDLKLLGKRNSIAHGSYVIVETDEYIELHEQVIQMLCVLTTQLENMACQKKYLR